MNIDELKLLYQWLDKVPSDIKVLQPNGDRHFVDKYYFQSIVARDIKIKTMDPRK